ncbi:MAG: hypothetical protein B6I22_01490 [Desulfobacteraceae bacterium 4572_123]|nr:MAG: hypothetical protein B6I22_01490 [Desulfobacteraceae bacterium 4572_123]
MIVIGTITFPQERANDVAQCYSSLPAHPDFIKIAGTYVYNRPEEDIRAFSIFKFDEDRMDDANAYFETRYQAFSRVKDLKSKHEEWLDVQDALKIVEDGDFDLSII